MDDKIIHKFEYSGEAICLLPDGRFSIGEEEGESRKTYESLALAQAAIDRRLQTRTRTKREKLDIPVYVKIRHHHRLPRSTPDSEEFVERKLVGVHGGLGTLLLDPPLDKDDTNTVYVRDDRVKSLLADETKLEQSLERIRQELVPFRLSDPSSYLGRIDETRHAQIVRKIKEKCGIGE